MIHFSTLVIQIRDKLERDIEKSYKALQENKLKILQKQEQKGSGDIKFVISENPGPLYSGDTMYSHKLLLYLRKHQSVMYNILIKADPKQRPCLGTLIADFMYNNIFSSDSIQEELLIMLYRTLQHEIKSLTCANKPSEFLKDSINKYILNTLAKNQDIKTFFGKVIIGLIDLMEGQEEPKELIFGSQELHEVVLKQKNTKNKKGDKDKGAHQNERIIGANKIGKNVVPPPQDPPKGSIFSMKDPAKIESSFGSGETADTITTPSTVLDKDTFFRVYIPDLTKSDLREKYEKAKDPAIKDYIDKQINLINKQSGSENIFANSGFLEQVFKCQDSTEVLELYQFNFSVVIELVNKLFVELFKKVSAVPNSIRYVCKIISMLVKKKFPNILQVELNAFVSEFLVKQIIQPLFVYPELTCLMNCKFISKITKGNMVFIGDIVQKLLSADFFTSKDDPSKTIFNWYFIDQMPEVVKFFDKLIDIDLPISLENIIQNDLSGNKDIFDIEEFVFDYFKQYPEEQIFYHNICYSANQLSTIIEIMKKNKDLMLKVPKSETKDDKPSKDYVFFKKAFEKLIEKSHLDNIQKVIDLDKNENTRTFCLITEKFYGSKLKAISKLKTQHFAIPEIPSPKDDTERTMNNVIRVKNSLSEILYNIHNIPKRDFFGYKIANMENFSNALTEISKINYYNLDNSVQTEWYILTFRSLINKVPEEYKSNNYSKLFTELTQALKQSINQMDYDTMSTVVDSYRYLDKELKQSEQNLKDFEQIEFYKKVEEFINNAPVEVYIKVFDGENGQKQLAVMPKSSSINMKFKYLDNFLFEKKADNSSLCNSVPKFIKKFPNIARKGGSIDEDSLFDYESNLNIPKALTDYFAALKEAIKAWPQFNFVQLMKDLEPEPTTKKNKKDEKEMSKKKEKNLEKERKAKLIEEGVNRVFREISNYIMDKIYDKLFPTEQETDDLKIFQKCVNLGWVSPHHLCSFGEINLDDFLPQTVGYIGRLDTTKNPIGKMELFGKINDIVLNTLNFIFGKCEGGVDDLLPLLTYVIIKSEPRCFSSHLKYIELYYPDLGNGKEGQRLTMLTAIKERLLDFKDTDLNHISAEEYNR